MEAAESNGWRDYQVTAESGGANPENKIHTDEVARSLGFAGGLVVAQSGLAHQVCKMA